MILPIKMIPNDHLRVSPSFIAVGCPWDALACMAKRPVPSEAKTAQCRQKQQAPFKAVAVAGNFHLGSMGSMGSIT